MEFKKKTRSLSKPISLKQIGFKLMLGLLLLTLSLTADNILFMDETGFYQRQYYTRSWSPIGKPCYAKIDATKGKRLNLMEPCD